MTALFVKSIFYIIFYFCNNTHSDQYEQKKRRNPMDLDVVLKQRGQKIPTVIILLLFY